MTRTSFPLFLSLWNHSQDLQTPTLHFEIATWLVARWQSHDFDLLLTAFRSSGKSTLVGLFASWLLADDPERRILVLAADHQLATKMVRTVRRILERHPLTSHLRPRTAEEWASDRFTVNRLGTHRDPSMLAKGITANITGSRADIVICDDVEVPNTCDTPTKRTELRERLDEIDFVLVPGGTRLFVGTPHTYHSIYADTVRRDAGETAPYLNGFQRLCLPIIDKAGDSRWPDRFSLSHIQTMRDRAGPAKFQSQMMLEPTDITEARLDPAAMIPYVAPLDYRESNGVPVLEIDQVRMISATCFWDPSFGRPGRGDRCAIAVVFSDAKGGRWLHDVQYLTHVPEISTDIDEATQLCRQVVTFARKYFLPIVTVEINGVGRFLPGLLRREISRGGLAAGVVEHTSTQNKSIRILGAFDALLAAGRLHVSDRVLASPFITEMREWRPGTNAPDDGLDAVAGCLLAESIRLTGAPVVSNDRARAKTSWRPGLVPVQVMADFEV